MKRSEINQVIQDAEVCFRKNGWVLPPNPRWDVTDFGLGNFDSFGLVLINLADETEYCEKLMYARKGQLTPAHTHRKKKEDIICRNGELTVQVWHGSPTMANNQPFSLKVNGHFREFVSGDRIQLQSGERITLTPGVFHEFYPESEACIIGEVSTANDDLNDNIFANKEVARFSIIDEDEAALIALVSD